MSSQPVKSILYIVTQLAVILCIPATIVALMTGYLRPSNAAIVSMSSTANATSLTSDSESRKRLWTLVTNQSSHSTP